MLPQRVNNASAPTRWPVSDGVRAPLPLANQLLQPCTWLHPEAGPGSSLDLADEGSDAQVGFVGVRRVNAQGALVVGREILPSTVLQHDFVERLPVVANVYALMVIARREQTQVFEVVAGLDSERVRLTLPVVVSRLPQEKHINLPPIAVTTG